MTLDFLDLVDAILDRGTQRRRKRKSQGVAPSAAPQIEDEAGNA